MKVTTDGCLFGAWVADEIKKLRREPKRILDIGTGTGLLSLMIAQITTHSEITGVEINASAYEEATNNFRHSSWSNRLKCLNLPIQDMIESQFDCIICNPPFFKNSQIGGNVNKNQALHSPSLSMTDLLASIVRMLNKKGLLFLLYPKKEMEEFTDLAKANGILPNQTITVRNQLDQPVLRTMRCVRFEDCQATVSEF